MTRSEIMGKRFVGVLILVAIVFGYLYANLVEVEHALGQTSSIDEDTVIVALGDSITAGVGATAGNGFVNILSERIDNEIINAGVSGDSTAEALARLERDVLSHDPDVVIIFLGGNDILEGVPRTVMFGNLREIISRIQDRDARVILVGIHGSIFSDDLENGFRNLAAETGSSYVPNVLMGVLGNPALMADAIHPNDAGHAVIAERILPVLRDDDSPPPTPVPQPAEPPLTGWCSIAANANNEDYRVQWNSAAYSRATSSPVYSWSGTGGVTSTNAFAVGVYPFGASVTGNVRVTAGDESMDLACSAQLPTRIVATSTSQLGGSCSPSISNMRVSWSAFAYGGSHPWDYSWSGSENLVGTTSTVEKVYTTEGVQTARVTITSAGQSLSLECQAKVASTTATGCFIATAAYGTEFEPQVETLRQFRDEKLLPNTLGQKFVTAYYSMSPPVADFIRDKQILKAAVRAGLTPIVYALGQD